MAYPSGRTQLPDKGSVLAADIGGTKSNLSLYKIGDGKLKAAREKTYATTDFGSCTEMLKAFLEGEKDPTDSICLGVAGPVVNGTAKGTNFPWEMDAAGIAEKLDIKSVTLINDMEANAYGLTALEEKDFFPIKKGTGREGNAVVISPGTGLGEAFLYWDGSRYRPFASEGGHCDFSPRNELDVALWKFLNKKFGHVSWERIISGQGIRNIYKFLLEYRGNQEPLWPRDKMDDKEIPRLITEAALEGKDRITEETLRLFLNYLAIEASLLALKAKAFGGIYIGGGILPQLKDALDKERFSDQFTSVGRLSDLLDHMPVEIVLNEKTALLGAAHYGAMTI